MKKNIKRKPIRKPKRGFSDRLYLLNFLFSWGYMVSIFWLTVMSNRMDILELSSYASGIPYVFAELGIHTGFIVWKAKVENCRKFKDTDRLEMLESEI